MTTSAEERRRELMTSGRMRITAASSDSAEALIAAEPAPYQVMVWRGGGWSCTCPGAQFARGKPCKHALTLALMTLAAAQAS